jgi:signal transduction histidine kinase
MRATLWRGRRPAIARPPDPGSARGWSFRARGSSSRRTASSLRVIRTIRAADAAARGAGYRPAMRFRGFVTGYGLDALVVLLFVLAEIEVWTADQIEGPTPVLIVGAALWTLPVLARRRFPFAAPAVATVAVAVEALIAPQSLPGSVAAILMVLVLGAIFGLQGLTARGVAGWALLVAAVGVVVLTDPEAGPGDLVFVGAMASVAWLTGLAFAERNVRTAELEERAARLEREREAEARAAVAEERARLAREMHDVVAHSLSVMVVQAEAAEAMLDSDPQRARRPLEAVQETGRSALTELRRMLGVLREMADEGPALAPQPGLAGLDALVASVRAAGLPVEVRVEGEPRPLPPGIDLSAYRIVQEGLTNALKHAGPARAEVVVTYGERELELRVSDDGRGHDPSGNGGHGLMGMRERVALFGGALDAGPQPEGGFALHARLPVEAPPS